MPLQVVAKAIEITNQGKQRDISRVASLSSQRGELADGKRKSRRGLKIENYADPVPRPLQKFDVGGVAGRGDPHLASVRIKVARQRELRHVLGPEGLLANQEELQHHARIIVDRVLTKLTGTDFNHGQYMSVEAQVERLIEEATSYENLSQHGAQHKASRAGNVRKVPPEQSYRTLRKDRKEVAKNVSYEIALHEEALLAPCKSSPTDTATRDMNPQRGPAA
ncbi:hypothetical protein Pmar_PMAR011788 [Perkinsus marinus ATCC 50983]|uniref:FATC domain-containing protein n=1 Tax=Perkinsus marinus (strain ATCC 50983 / TXsc) TaxID=423536 RepID=C5LCQ7_PERM5|nr:hypothetical protein Pmar_PMAR011788 [Perkinsus marinus ATCC 50983]EER05740.1 hypothetical protein Pmar_PMAR011788 [Perkinsus marinus ATCC 50983]|eukprot:XP_002773924.1 hypothetical protein Pmar_PMAR011788 [Perkinsus marinus ATCC 50983]